MITNRYVSAFVALLLGLGLTSARAETVKNSGGATAPAASTSPAASPTDGAAGPNASTPASAVAGSTKKTDTKKHQSRLDVLTEKLSLTDAQKEKISLILKDQRAAEKQLKKDISLPDDLRRTRRREIAESHDDQIRAELTQEQRAAFDQLSAKEHARHRM